MKCWLCGAEPLEVHDVSRFGDSEPSYLPGRWPAGDHEHAERPPTPGQLEQTGHKALMRIMDLNS